MDTSAGGRLSHHLEMITYDFPWKIPWIKLLEVRHFIPIVSVPYHISIQKFHTQGGLSSKLTLRVTLLVWYSFWVFSWKHKWEKVLKSMIPCICSIYMTSTQIYIIITYLAFDSENKLWVCLSLLNVSTTGKYFWKR